jgi:hypothetical protein
LLMVWMRVVDDGCSKTPRCCFFSAFIAGLNNATAWPDPGESLYPGLRCLSMPSRSSAGCNQAAMSHCE